MKRKRILALALSSIMIFSLAACGGNNNPTTSPSSTAPTSNTAETETEKPPDNQTGTSEADWIAAVKDPNAKLPEEVTIKIGLSYNSDFTYAGTETAENNAWMNLYKDLGINVEILYNVDATAAADKLNQAIASGNYPDIIGAGSTDYFNWSNQNLFTDLTDMYDKYMSEEAIEYMKTDNGLSLASAKIDGKLYGLPKIGNAYDSVMILFIRNDWLKNLGLDAPKTIDEFANIAKAFANDDPDQNEKKDTYGIGINGKGVFEGYGGIQSVFEMYGAIPGHWSNNFPFVVDKTNGGITWGGTIEPAMTEGFELLRDLYSSGAIPPDFITANTDTLMEDIASGKIGMVIAPMWGVMVPARNALQTQPNAEYIAVPLPGKTESDFGQSYLPGATESFYAVSSKCAHPEVLFKLFNLSMDKLVYSKDEEEFNKYYGSPNQYSGWKTSIIQTLIPLKNLDNYRVESAALKSGDLSECNVEQTNDVKNMQFYLDNKDKRDTLSAEDLAIFDAGLALYTVFGSDMGGYAALDKSIKNGKLNQSAFNGVPTATMAENFSILNTMVKEKVVNIISGNEEIAAYDKMLVDWNALKGDTILKEANEWYNTNN